MQAIAATTAATPTAQSAMPSAAAASGGSGSAGGAMATLAGQQVDGLSQGGAGATQGLCGQDAAKLMTALWMLELLTRDDDEKKDDSNISMAMLGLLATQNASGTNCACSAAPVHAAQAYGATPAHNVAGTQVNVVA